jgi:hypothetical protein
MYDVAHVYIAVAMFRVNSHKANYRHSTVQVHE